MADRPEPRRLERDMHNKMVAGVASGVANYFDLDPTIVRLAWVATFLFGGAGVIAYVVMWIVVPEGGATPTEQAAGSRTEHDEPASEEPADDVTID